MNIIKKRKIFLAISAGFILLSIALLLVKGLSLSIDFTGGSRIELEKLPDGKVIMREDIESVYKSYGLDVSSIQETDGGYRISSDSMSGQQKDLVIEDLNAQELSFEVLGPTIGSESRNKSIIAVLIAIVAITTYIAFAFWKSRGVISSWKFGVVAIIALFHDVIITLGAFSLFGILFDVQLDALFVTAILTIMGFSVHDTIVVFDRIRERISNNVKKLGFEEIIGNSITDTIGRSLNTSVTIIFVLFAMTLFGGESIRWFVIAFIIGVIVGTYSSIFVAAPILLEWHNFDKNGGLKNAIRMMKKKISR